MGIIVKKKEGEPTASLIYRFTKKIQQAGVLREAKKRRFSRRKITRNKRHLSAIYKANMKAKILKEKSQGLIKYGPY